MRPIVQVEQKAFFFFFDIKQKANSTRNVIGCLIVYTILELIEKD